MKKLLIIICIFTIIMATIPTFASNINKNANLTEEQLDTLYQTQNDLKIILSKIENIYSINGDDKQLKGSLNELKQVQEQAFVLNHEISSFINNSSELTPEEIDTKLDEIILKEIDLEETFHSIEDLIGKESTAKKVSNNTSTTIKNDSTQYMQNDSDIQNSSSSNQNNNKDHYSICICRPQSIPPPEDNDQHPCSMRVKLRFVDGLILG